MRVAKRRVAVQLTFTALDHCFSDNEAQLVALGNTNASLYGNTLNRDWYLKEL